MKDSKSKIDLVALRYCFGTDECWVEKPKTYGTIRGALQHALKPGYDRLYVYDQHDNMILTVSMESTGWHELHAFCEDLQMKVYEALLERDKA